MVRMVDLGLDCVFSLKYCFVMNMRMSVFWLFTSHLFECLRLIFMVNKSGPLNLKYVTDWT